jgi:hypothetical protein
MGSFRLLSRSWLNLAIFVAATLLMGCTSAGTTLPYLAQIESINPSLPGLEIRATTGGGGELEIKNDTHQEVMLINEQGQPYVRLVSDGVYELLGSNWVKTKDTSVYYCHDPRLAYKGPEPDSHTLQVIKQWVITGQLGNQTFTVSGQTIYTPNKN